MTKKDLFETYFNCLFCQSSIHSHSLLLFDYLLFVFICEFAFLVCHGTTLPKCVFSGLMLRKSTPFTP